MKPFGDDYLLSCRVELCKKILVSLVKPPRAPKLFFDRFLSIMPFIAEFHA